MKTRINKYIPLALDSIRNRLSRGANRVDARYDGYAASLGPAIRTSGLRVALSFYTDIHKNDADKPTDPRRHHILKVITEILIADGLAIVNPERPEALLTQVLQVWRNNNVAEQREIQQKIIDAVIAIKLSLRNFEQVKQ